MKTFEALSMLLAARDGQVVSKTKAVREYGKEALIALRALGVKEDEINMEYPKKDLEHGLFLVCNHPIVFAEQARASAAWLLERN